MSGGRGDGDREREKVFYYSRYKGNHVRTTGV